VAYDTMIWIALCVPLMILGIAVATVPIIVAMVHEHRYGNAGRPRFKRPEVRAPLSTLVDDVTVCTVCSSVVADLASHERAVHDRAA
jgi:hypothetical protein